MKEIEKLTEQDTKLKTFNLVLVKPCKDTNHVIRKQQQRAINIEMIQLALNYGIKKYTYEHLSYTITDKCLSNTIYYKHINKLRGLCVVGYWQKDSFHIITTYWNFTIKKRKRY